MIQKALYLSIFALFILPFIVDAQTETYKAKVIDIISQKEIQLDELNISTTEQAVSVEILEEPYVGNRVIITQNKFPVEKNEIVFVQESENNIFQILEKDRTQMILFIVLLFVVLILMINGLQGIKSIFGLVISFIMIIFVMLPIIIKGFNPLLVSILIGGLILSAVLFLSHGYTRGSKIALLGTLGAIICAGILSILVSIWMKLTGLGSDEALNAMVVTKNSVNFSDLLLGGIIIGMLGVLDDIAITQVAVVSEIKKANPLLNVKEVFVRALRVGKEHVSALVNTLILAYTGASFPLLILLYTSGARFDLIISQEIVVTEIVRTLVGSIGLIIAVPLTTYLAARYLQKEDNVESHCGHTHH